jgi:ferrochelatase
MLQKLAGLGVKNLLVVPLSFVSDHIETLHEIDIEYSKKAWELGIAKFERMPSLNSSPRFIEALASLVLKSKC